MARFYATVMIDVDGDYSVEEKCEAITQSIEELSGGIFEYSVCDINEGE